MSNIVDFLQNKEKVETLTLGEVLSAKHLNILEILVRVQLHIWKYGEDIFKGVTIPD